MAGKRGKDMTPEMQLAAAKAALVTMPPEEVKEKFPFLEKEVDQIVAEQNSPQNYPQDAVPPTRSGSGTTEPIRLKV